MDSPPARRAATTGARWTSQLFHEMLAGVMEQLRAGQGERRYEPEQLELAGRIFDELSTADQFADFLTSVAYQYLP